MVLQRKHVVLGIAGGAVLLILLPIIAGGIGRIIFGKGNGSPDGGKIKLAIWTLYDGRDVYETAVKDFLDDHPDFTVEYRRYTDPVEYRNLLVDEIAEGKGPDVAAFPNEWVAKDRHKFLPYPSGKNGLTTETFQRTFVGAASDDLLFSDAQGEKRIYGIPAFTDNLALYYNKRTFRDYVLGSNQPASAWNASSQDGLLNQVIKITRSDLSLERFLVGGIALGRTDNIRHGTDAFLLFLLQHGVQLYDPEFKNSALVTQRPSLNSNGLPPFIEALKFFTSFAVQDFQQYTWNDLLTKREFDELELGAFATGKVAMFYGYASDYEKIRNSIRGKSASGKAAISSDDVGIMMMPQLNAQGTTRSTFARYFPFVVPATSKYPEEAWDLISRFTSSQYQQETFEKHHRITTLTSLLEKQAADPVYGVFAQQTAYARSLSLLEPAKMRRIFSDAIMDVVNNAAAPNAAAIRASARLQCVLDQINRVAGREAMNCLEGT